MAVLCLFPNTPWPWSTPSRAASAGYGKSGRQAIPNRLFEECLGCGYISCPTGPEVDSLPSLVYCPIQIGPLSAYLEIGFIDSLRAASAAAKAIPPLDELWRYRRTQRWIVVWASWSPRSAIISTRSRKLSLVAQIPTHAQKDHLAVKCRPANNSSMFLSLPIVSPRSKRPLYPTASRYLHQSHQRFYRRPN